MRSASSREPNQMKKLHSASIGAAPLAAICAIRRIASASPLLWPLAMLLYVPAVSRLAIVIGNLGARARARATIALTRFRTGEMQRRVAAVVAKASPSFWRLQAGIAGSFALVAAGLMATTIPLVYAQAQPISANGSTGNQTSSVGAQNSAPPVNVSVSSQAARKYETNPILSLPAILARQWTPDREDLPGDACLQPPKAG